MAGLRVDEDSQESIGLSGGTDGPSELSSGMWGLETELRSAVLFTQGSVYMAAWLEGGLHGEGSQELVEG